MLIGFLMFAFLLPSFIKSLPAAQMWIPNGSNVPNPCDRKQLWSAVGHEFLIGPGPMNLFGRNFLAFKKTWTVALCKMDSDGDGRTNGEELGDPNCQWSRGQPFPPATNLSHPGICEPIKDPRCRQKNEFLETIDICRNALNLPPRHWCPSLLQDPAVKTSDLNFIETELPTLSTVHLCQQFSLPSDNDYNIIAWEPLIDTLELVSQVVIFGCIGESDEAALANNISRFQNPELCDMVPPFCRSVIILWTASQLKRCYSDETGVLIGNHSLRHVIMQVRYNNPSLYEDISVSSGFRLYYTPNRREHELGILNFGQIDFAIPPNSPNATVTAKAFNTRTCSKLVLGTQPRFMASILFRTRKLGSHVKLVLRKASGAASVIVDEDISNDRPKWVTWSWINVAPVIFPGDNLEIECIFKSTGKSDYTFFGPKVSDESCMVFMELTPRVESTSFFTLMNFIDKNECLMISNSSQPSSKIPPLNVSGCSLNAFRSQLKSLHNNTGGGLANNCLPQEMFPAANCTAKCYNFLRNNNLNITNPCLKNTTFSYATAFTEYNTMEDVYRAQSEIAICMTKGLQN